MNQIRPIAIGVFRNQDRILVFEGYEKTRDEIFYRPLGGGIEFGERSEDALRRELMEEINADVGEVRCLGVLENIYRFNNNPYHEIVVVYDGVLNDSGLYEQAVMEGQEANGAGIRAMWKSLDEFRSGKLILYPPGLLDLLSE